MFWMPDAKQDAGGFLQPAPSVEETSKNKKQTLHVDSAKINISLLP